MISGKTDRRTERTRQALMTAFIGEMLSRGYSEISVEEIAERANVGRSTFYAHYRSKEDILKESVARPSSLLSILVGGDVPLEMVVMQLMHFHEQRTRNGTFFRDPIRRIWVSVLAGMIEPRLVKVARNSRAQPQLPLPFIAMQIAEAQIALIANWLMVRPALKGEALAEALIASTRANLVALLGVRPDASLTIPGERLKIVQG
jgi:AcrR family transcriptional regulator